MSEKQTPMMRQYHAIKRKLSDALLFYRMGDFYELFFEDAVVAARELEITLTARGKDSDGVPVPMCGVPHHAVESYMARLVKNGFKVAICDQMEEARPGKLVKREVVRIVTAGTVTEDLMLEPRENNFLCSLLQRGDGFGAAFLDVSTGDFFATEYRGEDAQSKLIVELNHFQPAEILYPAANAPLFTDRVLDMILEKTVHSQQDDWLFRLDFAQRILLTRLRTTTLDGFGLAGRDLAVAAAGALLHYVEETSRLSLDIITGIQFFEDTDFLKLDTESVANLELVQGLDGGKKHTLLRVLDFTVTHMGARRLKSWILRPLMNRHRIIVRQDGIAELVDHYLTREQLRGQLKPVQDVERLLGKITTGTARPRDLLALKTSLGQFPAVQALLAGLSADVFRESSERFDPLDDLWALLERALHEDPPANLNEGGILKDGFQPELDELRSISRGGKDYIAAMEERERRRTGIGSLKVGYNKVFGYYIEVTRPNLHLVPADYIRKQTLANAERFITEELKDYEEKVLHAEERIIKLERELFHEIRRHIAEQSARLIETARIIARTDALAALAEAAVRHDYRRPTVTDSAAIHITAGRHPVLEHREESFVPNDCLLNDSDHRMIILTGPNMGGKSTYLRQVALIVIMAQLGSFVPAARAEIGLVDQIFTRVGASDNLARGRSTFMVEMIETANILNTCTRRSLILLDEVGRGTATFDGLSIAWSVAEYIITSEVHCAKTLFATHYHELTRLADVYAGIANYCVTVKEGVGDIIFLRQVAPGSANRSYGIEVARLAGMPRVVVQRAGQILKKLERKELDLSGSQRNRAKDQVLDELQKKLFD